METLLLLAQIAQAFSLLATNPAFGKDGQKVGQIASLVGLAFQQSLLTNEDRRALLEQIKAAIAQDRLLTDEEMNGWRHRHTVAKAAIEAWQPQR